MQHGVACHLCGTPASLCMILGGTSGYNRVEKLFFTDEAILSFMILKLIDISLDTKMFEEKCFFKFYELDLKV